MSNNTVTLTGNLTRDVELRSTASGTPVMKFGIAVNERIKNGDQWEDYPNFIECTMFGKRAEGVSKYLSKGSKVAVEGHLRYSQWEKDGQKRSKLEVIVDEIELMSGQQSQQQSAPAYSAPSYSTPSYPASSVYDEDIPF